MARWLAIAVLVTTAGAGAVDTQMSASDMRRVLDIARGSETERARFHAPYIFRLTDARLDYLEVEQVEVITELRRLELIGEEHARINDVFGRGTLREAEQALVPWRHRVAVVARLRFLPTTRMLTGVPPVIVVLADSPSLPLDTTRKGIYSNSEQGSFLVGATVEAVFDAVAAGAGAHAVSVLLDGKEIGRITIDFGSLR